MPDEAREIVFPDGVPVRMSSERDDITETVVIAQPQPPSGEESASANEAEGDLLSEANEIEQQAKQSRSPESGQNLLED